MRKESAPAEQIVWQLLRNRQLNGFKFRRQVAIDRYIADFLCADANLIVELDGDSHSESQKYDEARTLFLQSLGFTVLRFANRDVFENLANVLEAVIDASMNGNNPSPRPSSLGTGEREEEH